MPKIRIDQLMIERNQAQSLQQAAALLMAGRVTVDQQPVTLPGLLVSTNAEIVVTPSKPYVSRGGYKLAAALEAFEVSVMNAVCADVGASMGGFTDVLLQHGAAKVYAIDVAYGDLDWTLRQDARVIALERTNARKLNALPEVVSVVTVDVSFISLKQILPVVRRWAAPTAGFIALIKPQFEAEKSQVEKGGVVKNRPVHQVVLKAMLSWSLDNDFSVAGLIPSPLTGPAGNKEFLLYLTIGQAEMKKDALQLIEDCLDQVEYL
jgi:23S rRNA (cytidine1920-2'-O)/16S rRNA (cytidine1409-2'-O)-methyltransferase